MGNCNSSTAYRKAAIDTYASDLLDKDKSTTEYMDLQEELEDSTILMSSPGSSTFQSSESSPVTWLTSPRSALDTSDTHCSDALRISVPSTATASASLYTPPQLSPIKSTQQSSPQRRRSTTPARRGKALQNRLDKARQLQTVLSMSGSLCMADEDASDQECSVSLTSTVSQSSVAHGSQLAKLTRTGLSTTSKALNEEFDASMSQSMIWTEAELGDAVSCITFSREPKVFGIAITPLLMAVGTKDGGVTIYQVVDDGLPLASKAIDRDNANEDDDASASLQSLFTAPRRESESERLRIVTSFRHAGGQVRSLDFSPDGTYLAVGGDDCYCSLYKLACRTDTTDDCMSLEVLLKCRIERVDRVYCVRFSPDGAYLAVGGFDGTVAILLADGNLASSEPELVVEIGRDGLIFTLDWSHDSRYLAIGGSDKSCAIIDTQTSWNVAREIRRPASVVNVKWHPDNSNYLVVASNKVAVMEHTTLSVKYELESECTLNNHTDQFSLCWSPNGAYIVTSMSRSHCAIYETKTFAKVQEVSHLHDVTALVWAQRHVAPRQYRRYLAIGSANQRVVVMKAGLDLSEGIGAAGDNLSSSSSSLLSQKSEWTLKGADFYDIEDDCQTLESCEDSDCLEVTALAFSRGSKSRPSTFIAYGLDDASVMVRSTIDLKMIAELRFASVMNCLAFSNGSRFLALGSTDGKLFVVETVPCWSVVTQKELGSAVQTLGYSKHNERLAVGLQDGRLLFFSPSDSYSVASDFTESTACITEVDWSSRNFALSRLDGSVAIFENQGIFSDQVVPLTVLQQTSPVRSLSFGASGRFLAVGGINGMVNVYSARGGWVRCHHVQVPPGLDALAWSATGRFLALAGQQNLTVIETIFWTNIPEACLALLANDLSDRVSNLAFSQDENLLAMSVQGNGVRIIDCKLWKLYFTMNKTN